MTFFYRVSRAYASEFPNAADAHASSMNGQEDSVFNSYMKWLRPGMCALALVSVSAIAAEGDDPDANKDSLERARDRGLLNVCADPYQYPQAEQNTDPPGFDVEIVRAIAKEAGLRLNMVWTNTASRGGTSRAFRQSILANKCDVFLGMSDNGDDDMLMGKLVFTKPYIGLGYVLVTQGKAVGMTTLDELKQAKLKVGVSMSTPMDDYLFMHEIPRELYMGSRRMMDGMVKGEVDAGMMFSTTLGTLKHDAPNALFKMAQGFVPMNGLRFNGAWVVRKSDKAMQEFINKGIETLLQNGRVKEIVESYGVPYYAPFS